MCIFKFEGPHKNLGTERKQQQGSVWAHLGNVWCTMMHFCVMVPHGSFGACLDPAVTQANVSLKGRTKEERLSKLRQNYDPKQWIQGNQSAMFECLMSLARLARWALLKQWGPSFGAKWWPQGGDQYRFTRCDFSMCPIYPWIWIYLDIFGLARSTMINPGREWSQGTVASVKPFGIFVDIFEAASSAGGTTVPTFLLQNMYSIVPPTRWPNLFNVQAILLFAKRLVPGHSSLGLYPLNPRGAMGNGFSGSWTCVFVYMHVVVYALLYSNILVTFNS